MNSWGYYVERNTDEDQIPEFLSGFETITAKERYRLMEFRPPTENLKVYSSNLQERYNTEWFKNDVVQKLTRQVEGLFLEQSRKISSLYH